MMCRHGTSAVVLLPGEGERADDVAERVAAATPGRLHAGLSAPVGPDRLPLALYEANSAANIQQTGAQPAGTAQTVVVRFHSLGTTALLLTLLSREALTAIVSSLLGPVQEYDARTGGDLLRSLRTFLRHDARWEEAAAELHIHRHTLRYRLQRIEALTSRNLTSAQSRSEFWLALEAQALLEQSGGVGLPSAVDDWTAGTGDGTGDGVVVEAAGAWGRVGVQTASPGDGGASGGARGGRTPRT
jgi:purine catabolism regulator